MSFISKTLNDYLFGTGGETKIVNLRIGEWEKKYKPILNPNHDGMHNYTQARNLPKFIYRRLQKYGTGGSENWNKVHKYLYKDSFGYFETYGEDLEFVKKQNPLCVWTEIHASGSFEGIQSGFMSVDRMLYYVTEVPRDETEFISVDYHYDCQDEYEYPDCCEKDCYVCEDRFINDELTEISKGKFKCNFEGCEEEE